MYALVDGNNFYVSCERVFRPSLNGKPVIVLSNNDGCAIARSNEPKPSALGWGIHGFRFGIGRNPTALLRCRLISNCTVI